MSKGGKETGMLLPQGKNQQHWLRKEHQVAQCCMAIVPPSAHHQIF